MFRSRPKQAELFEFLVRNALAGNDVAEKDIRTKFFPWPPYKPESTIARTTVNHVRRLANEYYDEGGSEDSVLIAFPQSATGLRAKLPPGKAYKPTFSYNPRSWVDQEYRRGLFQLAQCSFNGEFFAMHRFEDVLLRNPNHTGAHLGMAAIYMRQALCGRYGTPAREVLDRAEENVQTALRIDSRSWKAYSLLGAIHCCRWQWAEAAEAFAQALKNDPVKTRHGSWHYPAYLMVIGRTEEALEMVRVTAGNNPENPGTRTLYGIFLYATRQYSEAFGELTEAAFADLQDWLAEIFVALVYLEEEHPTPKIEATDWFFKKLQRRSKHKKWVTPLERAYELMRTHEFPGLTVLCIAHARQMRHARNRLEQLEQAAQKRNIPPLELALARMALGQNDKALEALEQARQEHTPFLAWMHLWPLLDPLRETPEFKAFIRRMKLPAASPHLPAASPHH